MKKLNKRQINTPYYWDKHQTNTTFGLREQKYRDLVGYGETIIDLGCGLSPFLSQVDYEERWGVDFSPETIDKARELYPSVNYYCGDITKTLSLPNYYDAVVCGEVIEHLEKPELLLKEMERICKPGGIMVISTPILEIDEPEHLWEFTAEDFLGWNSEIIESEKFKGRKYLFVWKTK